ncbi:shieldin complex subunit 1 [Hyperolius riggenbachi]|uniref:shieldin complex subunit 1 n=1 Tax=Hyperolius riggenbachi TaxID=752182 RepID=UPI0035A2ECBE
MEVPEEAESQSSEHSSVLDLSCTYDIADSVVQQEPIAGTSEDYASCVFTPSASSLDNTGYRISHSEDSEMVELERDERSSAQPLGNDTSCFSDQRNIAATFFPKLAGDEDINDGHIRAALDAFYAQSSQTGDNPYSRQLSGKISELKQKNHLYALRSCQMAKVILDLEGTKILENRATDDPFASNSKTEPAANLKPVPGLSQDVVTFLTSSKNTEEDT